MCNPRPRLVDVHLPPRLRLPASRPRSFERGLWPAMDHDPQFHGVLWLRLGVYQSPLGGPR